MKTMNLKKTVLFLVFLLSFSVTTQAQESRIEVNQLPVQAKNFINNNFKSETISYVLKDENFLTVDDYNVVFTDGTELEFNRNGDWKEVSNKTKPIKTSFIPTNIVKYYEKSFPNTQVIKIEKSKWKYELKLTNGLELVFDSKGNFLRIDD